MVLLFVACIPEAPVPTAVVTRADVQVELSFQGELEAEKSVDLVVPRVSRRPEITFMAPHGDPVEAGQEVVRFDTEEAEKKLRELRAQRAVTLTRIASEQAKLGTKRDDAARSVTRAQLDAASAERRTTDSEAVPRVDREQARIDAQKAGIDIRIAENLQDRTDLDANTQVRLLQLEVDDIDEDIARYTERVEKATLRAPGPGLLLHAEHRWSEERLKVGDELWPGATVVHIPDLSTLKVRAWAHEVDAPRIQVGQVGKIVLDAVPDQPTAGEVTHVADLAHPRGDTGAKHVEVQLELDDSRPAMKPGMTVEVQLQVAHHRDAVSLPLEAVFWDDQGSYAWVSGLTGFERVPLVVHDDDGERAVVDGIEVGVQVATFDPAAWDRGERP